MKFITTLILFLSFLICQSQVNPNYHKVKGYYRKDGTYVKSHYRTNRNNTNRDNYSTKPNINPWTGKKGYINPDNQTSNYRSTSYKQSIYHTKTSNYTKSSITKKTVFNYYPTKGNSKTIMVTKLRNKPDVFGNVIIRIPKGVKIQKIKKYDDYWKVQYGSQIGYLNEMYLSSTTSKSKNYNTNYYSSKKNVSNYYPTKGNSKTTIIAKLRNKPNVFGNVIIRIPKGAKIQKIKKYDDYWKVQYGSQIGYLNEMYLSSATSKSKNYNTNYYSSKKTVSNYYPIKGSSKTTMVTKLRNKPDVFGNVIIRIPKGVKIQKIKKYDDYWKVQYGNQTGYLNEMYIE